MEGPRRFCASFLGSAAALAIVAASFAGCFGPEGIHITATRPWLMTTYSYDGRGVHDATGSLEIRLDADKDTGTVRATARDAFHAYEVEWRGFHGRQPYQSGGVATRLDMWGVTGNGTSAFPKMHVYVAVFGHVESRVDGELEKDPTNLEDLIPAVLFVTQGRHRDPETRRIDNAQKLGPYDPAKPEDVYVNEIGSQAVLLLFTARGELWRHLDYQEVAVRSL